MGGDILFYSRSRDNLMRLVMGGDILFYTRSRDSLTSLVMGEALAECQLESIIKFKYSNLSLFRTHKSEWYSSDLVLHF